MKKHSSRNGIATGLRAIAITLTTSVFTCGGGIAAHAFVVQEGQDAQGASIETASFPYYGVVNGENLYIRCGAGDAFYPFGKLPNNAVVNVVEERFGWARVQTRGPAFRKLFGYVPSGKVRVSDDGKTAIALGSVRILAPNAYRDFAPESSWRPIGEVATERPLRVVGSVESDATTYLKVELPETTHGWVATNDIRKASKQEVASYFTSPSTASADAGTSQPAGAGGQSTTEGTVSPPPADGGVSVAGSGANRSDTGASATPVSPSGTTPETVNDPLAKDADDASSTVSMPDLQNPKDASSSVRDGAAGAESSGDSNVQAQNDAPASDADNGAEAEPSLLDELEASYEALKRVPIREAEIDTVLEQYRRAIESGSLERRGETIAKARIQMLEARHDVKRKLLEIDRLRNLAEVSTRTAEAARMQLEAAVTYATVGVIKASSIYDGTRLPRLFRIADPATGRTMAYLEPSEKFDLLGMLGQVVGVAGKRSYNDAMRVNIIEPTRVDLLTRAADGQAN